MIKNPSGTPEGFLFVAGPTGNDPGFVYCDEFVIN